MKKRFFAALIAAAFVVLNIIPTAALGAAPKDDTPAGYNAQDFLKAVAFMETEDENGVKNGEKIVSFFSGSYDPKDPETWSYFYYDHENAIIYIYGIFWTDGADRRVSSLYLYGMDLVGELDLSEMNDLCEVYCDSNRLTAIDASGCGNLRALTCKNNKLQELSISGCTTLDLFDCSDNSLVSLYASDCVSATDIECANNLLETLDVSGCAALEWLNCSNNRLTGLDVSNNASLDYLYCTGNYLTVLDLSNNPALPFDMIRAVGQGHIGFCNYGRFNEAGNWVVVDAAIAEPALGSEFIGWYGEDGALISTNPELRSGMTGNTRVFARFSGEEYIPGDANGDGLVDTTDALLVLRASMGIMELSAAAEASCDLDHNGTLDAADALNILRFVLGLTDTL